MNANDNWDKRTNKRIHIIQMREDERTLVRMLLDSIENIQFAKHIDSRRSNPLKRGKRISKMDMIATFRVGEIVEVNNNTPDDVRVLLRLDFPNDGRAVCIVVSLKSNLIITAFSNDINDRHDNLDVMQYQWVNERLTFAIPRILGTDKVRKIAERLCAKSNCALSQYCK